MLDLVSVVDIVCSLETLCFVFCFRELVCYLVWLDVCLTVLNFLKECIRLMIVSMGEKVFLSFPFFFPVVVKCVLFLDLEEVERVGFQ